MKPNAVSYALRKGVNKFLTLIFTFSE